MKKVSIIIPTYNQAKYLSQAIDSALRQTYPNLEIIVCDDKSTDNTSAVVAKYQTDQRLKYFRNQDNLGRVGNYHQALYEYAQGDYFLNLDGDDYLIDNDFIAQAVNIFENNSKIVLVYAKIKVYFEKDGSLMNFPLNKKMPAVIDGNELFLNYYKNYYIPHLATVVKREAAVKIGYYEKDIISADWESVLRLILNNQVGYLDFFASVWRKHKNNASRNFSVTDIFSNIEYILRPYEYALNNNIFSQDTLDRWRFKMLKSYFVRNLATAIIIKDLNLENDIYAKVKNYNLKLAKNLQSNLSLKILRLISKNDKLLFFVFKYILKAEYYLKDLRLNCI